MSNSTKSTSTNVQKYLLTAALGLMLLVNGCQDETVAPIIDNTPKPAFSATIDGVTWTAAGPGAVDDLIFARGRIAGKVELKAHRTTNNVTDVFTITLTAPKEGVNELRPEFDQPDQTGSFSEGSSGLLYFMTDTDSGSVTLTNYSTTSTRISGTFKFSATNNAQKKISIASGTFKDLLVKE